MGKGGGGGTTVTKSEPWDEQKGYLRGAMQSASDLYNASFDKNGNLLANSALAPAYYSGNTVAPQSAWTKQALTMQANAAKNMASNPLMQAAKSGTISVANGDALDGNQGLAQLNHMALRGPVSQYQAIQGNSAMNSLNALANSDTLAGNSGYGTLNALAGQATGKGNAGLTALNRYAGQNLNAGNAALRNLQGTTGAGINAGNAAMSSLGAITGQGVNAGNAALSSLGGITGAGINAGNATIGSLQGMTGAGINAGNAGMTQLNDLAQNDNPYMDALYQRANSQAQASLDSNFNRAGRYGSGAHEAAAADAANNLAD